MPGLSPSPRPLCSVVMSTRDKSAHLARTLRSIRRQLPPFPYEVITIDDGSTDDTEETCRRFETTYRRLDNPEYRNPSVARNVGYRLARGKVIIAQSDDVIHETPDAIERLTHGFTRDTDDWRPLEFLIATVWNVDPLTLARVKKPVEQFAGPENQRPFFFLGSVMRRDLYAVGGCEERFVAPAFDDDRMADALIRGLGLRPRFLTDVIGLHQHHDRPKRLAQLVRPSQRLYEELTAESERTGNWVSSGGPWEYVE